MTRAEWLAWRRLGLGGSDLAVVLGCEMWGSPWQLWLDKTHGVADDRSGEDIATGKRLESAVIEWANEETGAQGRPWIPGTPTVHPEHSWLRGSPDAWLYNQVGCEAKVSADYLWDEVPAAYQAQVRLYMAIFGCESWIVAVFFRRVPAWRMFRVYRDLDIEHDMIAAAQLWWNTHVLKGDPPDIDETRAAGVGLAKLHTTSSDEYRVATDLEIRLLREYNDTDQALRRMKVERDRLGNHIRHAIAGDAGLRFSGGRAKWTRSKKPNHAGKLTVRIDDF